MPPIRLDCNNSVETGCRFCRFFGYFVVEIKKTRIIGRETAAQCTFEFAGLFLLVFFLKVSMKV